MSQHEPGSHKNLPHIQALFSMSLFLQSFMEFKPDFELFVPAGNRRDENKSSEIDELLLSITGMYVLVLSSRLKSISRRLRPELRMIIVEN